MSGENTNPASAGSDSAQPSDALDNPDNLNFAEPEEEQAAPEAEKDGAEPDSESADTAEGEEAEESETEQASEDDDSADASETDKVQPKAKDDVIVDVQGEKVPLGELKSGYMRQKDYTHKTQEIGNKRRELETLTSRVTNSVNAIAELLIAQAPKAPDPSLAMTDPGRYVQEKALHEAAMAQINTVIEKASDPKDVANTLTQEQRSEYLQSENAKLAQAFPQTAKPETRKKFFDDAMSAARELGYSEDEIVKATDHRLFKLAHYARMGMAAEQAKAKAAQKVVNVPAMAPNKRQAPTASKARANQDAMKRLAKTGSIHDAMAIDFE